MSSRTFSLSCTTALLLILSSPSLKAVKPEFGELTATQSQKPPQESPALENDDGEPSEENVPAAPKPGEFLPQEESLPPSQNKKEPHPPTDAPSHFEGPSDIPLKDMSSSSSTPSSLMGAGSTITEEIRQEAARTLSSGLASKSTPSSANKPDEAVLTRMIIAQRLKSELSHGDYCQCNIGNCLGRYVASSAFSGEDEPLLARFTPKTLAILKDRSNYDCKTSLANQLGVIKSNRALFLIASAADVLFQGWNSDYHSPLIEVLQGLKIEHLFTLTASLQTPRYRKVWSDNNKKYRRVIINLYSNVTDQDLPLILDNTSFLSELGHQIEIATLKKDLTTDQIKQIISYGDIFFIGLKDFDWNNKDTYRMRFDLLKQLHPDGIKAAGKHLRDNRLKLFKPKMTSERKTQILNRELDKWVKEQKSNENGLKTSSETEESCSATSSTKAVTPTPSATRQAVATVLESRLASDYDRVGDRLAAFVKTPDFPPDYEHFFPLMRSDAHFEFLRSKPFWGTPLTDQLDNIESDKKLFLIVAGANQIFKDCDGEARKELIDLFSKGDVDYLQTLVTSILGDSQNRWPKDVSTRNLILKIYFWMDPSDLDLLLRHYSSFSRVGIGWNNSQEFNWEHYTHLSQKREQWRQIIPYGDLFFMGLDESKGDAYFHIRVPRLEALTPESIQAVGENLRRNRHKFFKSGMTNERKHEVIILELNKQVVKDKNASQAVVDSETPKAASSSTAKSSVALESPHETTAQYIETILESNSDRGGDRLGVYIRSPEFPPEHAALLPRLIEDENLALLKAKPFWGPTLIDQLDSSWSDERLFLLAAGSRHFFAGLSSGDQKSMIKRLGRLDIPRLYNLVVSFRSPAFENLWPQDKEARKTIYSIFPLVNASSLSLLLNNKHVLPVFRVIATPPDNSDYWDNKNYDKSLEMDKELWEQIIPFGNVFFGNEKNQPLDERIIKKRIEKFKGLSPQKIKDFGDYITTNQQTLFSRGMSEQQRNDTFNGALAAFTRQ